MGNNHVINKYLKKKKENFFSFLSLSLSSCFFKKMNFILIILLFVKQNVESLEEDGDIQLLLNKNTTNRRLNRIYKNFDSISSLIKKSELLGQKLIDCELNFNLMINNETKRREELFKFESNLRFYQYMTNFQTQIFKFFK
jgi:hypothetical protein